MRSRKRWSSVLGAAAVVAVLAVIAAGCGSSNKKSASSTSSSGSNSGKTFDTLHVVWGDTDYMDPGLSYRLESWQLFQNIYEGLVTQKHASGADSTTVIPALASALPTVSSDAKNYKFTLRKGLKYSNGKPVKASDFPATIIRDFNMNSPGVGFYSNIVGSEGCEKNPTTCKSISGIIADDSAGTVEIKLQKPQSDFLYVLSLPFSALVPKGTPAKPLTNPPPPANGPYVMTSYQPHKSFVIKRNPNYKAGSIPTVPQGNPDVVIGTITDDLAASAQKVISGSADYDENLLPTDRLSTIQKKYGDQVKFFTTPSTYYFFMNQRTPPFDNLKARMAVNYGIDRDQLVKIRGGLGKTTQNFLPPTYPQYKKIDFYKHDVAKAKQLVQQSGTAGQAVTVYGVNTDPSKSVVEYLAGQLTKMGYKANVKLLAHGVYFTTIGNQATKAQTGWADWYQDYPNPIDWFDVLFNGNRITQTHNNNYGNSDFASVNSLIEKLKNSPTTTAAQNGLWAKVDSDLVTKYAATVPYINRSGTDFFSKKMKLSGSCYQFHVLYQWDFSTSCQK